MREDNRNPNQGQERNPNPNQEQNPNPNQEQNPNLSQSPAQMREMQRIQDENKLKKSNRQLWQIMTVVLLLFVSMIGYLCYFMVYDSETVIQDSHNKRISNRENQVTRGSIYSSDGQVIAYTEEQDGEDVRVYPFNNVFAHPIGYTSMGVTELEKAYNYELLCSSVSFPERLYTQMKGEKLRGDNVVTTLDAGLQSACYDFLGDRKGVIVVVEVETGKVLAMVSKPSYNPNTLEQDWAALTSEENQDGNLMNRAVQSLYPPGSTFKVLTLLEFIRENPDTYQDYQYECTGTEYVENYALSCFDGEVHGLLNTVQALQMSCNVFFGHIAKSLNRSSWQETVERFGFNQTISFETGLANSAFSVTDENTEAEVMMKAIGQENVRETPLMNAMIMAAIGNDGVMMKPYLVDHLENADGEVLESTEPEEYSTVMTEEESNLMKQYLQAVVEGGGGINAKSDLVTVGGKTGTAQYTSYGTDHHGWFFCLAPVEDTKIAVSVFLETGATGGLDAAPVAKQVIEYYFQNN